MSKIYITGDTHGFEDCNQFLWKNFSEKKLTKDDYVIICGDAGFIWDYPVSGKEEAERLKWLEEQSWTTLFIDGNHENFDRLRAFNVEEWNGGKIQRINNSLFHLMRGEIYTIDNNTIFCFGGAQSMDKIYRIPGKSWWPEEEPTNEDFENAMDNLEKVNYEVDYIITHDIPVSFRDLFYSNRYKKSSITNQMLEGIEHQCKYKKWYAGHWHIDMLVNDRFRLMYKDICELGE